MSGCQRMFRAFFLLAASTCCCQKMDWNESFGRPSKNCELSDDVTNCLKSSCDCSSRATPLTSVTSSIFFFSRSSCLDIIRCWCCSWLRRLMSVGRGWYLLQTYITHYHNNYYQNLILNFVWLPYLWLTWLDGEALFCICTLGVWTVKVEQYDTHSGQRTPWFSSTSRSWQSLCLIVEEPLGKDKSSMNAHLEPA